MGLSRLVLLGCALLIAVPTSPAHGQSAHNVAVVVNELSTDSQRIGEHYARARGVPSDNLLRIQTTPQEEIDRETYLRAIERPLGQAITNAKLQDRLLYLVLTKGVPLRIKGTPGLDGTGASVDSELTLLYRRLTGTGVEVDGPIENPYFLGARDPAGARSFSHRDHDIYLVTRLDGFTAEDVLTLIDRARTPVAEGRIVLDQRSGAPAATPGDQWLRQAAERLSAAGHERRVLLETTSRAAHTPEPVLGLYTWGAGDPEQRRRVTGLKFVTGSVAANLASFDARTFREPPASWKPTGASDRDAWFAGTGDALIGDLIREGVTGVSGQVGEAYVRGAIRPDILFPAYLAGFNLAEAFYLAMPVLSWQTIVVGDPLMAPFEGRRMTSDDADGATDPETGLPRWFAERRIDVIASANRDVPRGALAPYLRALTHLEAGDRAAAARTLADAVRAAPKDSLWLTALATLQEQAADYAGAAATYRDALALQPGNIVALNNLAFALATHLGKPADALPLARRAVSLAPNSGIVLDTLAWTEHLLGNATTASKLAADAVRMEPSQPDVRLHAAIIYAAAGAPDLASAQLKEALRLKPDLASRDEVRELRSQLGMPPGQ